jgi:Resolvase, N terminal domain
MPLSMRKAHLSRLLMKALLPGDTVVVTKLDRLARSSRDLHNILFELESLSVGFQSLKDSWCDTTSPAGKLMLTIFGALRSSSATLSVPAIMRASSEPGNKEVIVN